LNTDSEWRGRVTPERWQVGRFEGLKVGSGEKQDAKMEKSAWLEGCDPGNFEKECGNG
jgi:hypothetical protein